MFWVSGMEFRGDGHLLRRGAEDVPVQRPPKLVDRRLAPPAGVVPELRAARDRRVQPGYLPPAFGREVSSSGCRVNDVLRGNPAAFWKDGG